MRLVGPCLTLVVVKNNAVGESILPIWPPGFGAEAFEGPGGPILRGPMGTAKDAVGAERLELHGQFLDSPPGDAVVPEACAGYRLFLVGRALNIAT